MGQPLVVENSSSLIIKEADRAPIFEVRGSTLKDVLEEVRACMVSYLRKGIKVDDDGLDILSYDEALDHFLDQRSPGALSNSFVRITLLTHTIPILDAAARGGMPAPEVCNFRKNLCLNALRHRIATAQAGTVDTDCIEDFFNMIELADWTQKETLCRFVRDVEYLTDGGY